MALDPESKQRARDLRHNATPAERILWKHLRGRRFVGIKFRRQQPLGPFIADLFCAELRLIIELNGETHVGREAADRRRQQWLEDNGFKVLRFWNTDIYEDLEVVLEAIWNECERRRAMFGPARLEK